MADDEPWEIEDPSEDAPVEETSAPETPANDVKPQTEEPTPAEPEESSVTENNDTKKLIFKHWVRPKFLQYGYLYDYQRNYYDDVIDFLDRRQWGYKREVPRAQTWAERALRTYTSKPGSTAASRASLQDRRLLAHISSGARFHRYHSKSLISRKYSSLGFTTITI